MKRETLFLTALLKRNILVKLGKFLTSITDFSKTKLAEVQQNQML